MSTDALLRAARRVQHGWSVVRAADKEGVGVEELRAAVDTLDAREAACRRIAAEEYLLEHRRRVVGTWERLSETAERVAEVAQLATSSRALTRVANAHARVEHVLLKASAALYGVDADLAALAPLADESALDLAEAQGAERLPEEDW